MTFTPCIDCGEPSPTTRCPEHTKPDLRGSAAQRGYDRSWQALSRRARRMQPFCTDCGTRDDLTVDHTPEAWARRERGLTIRLQDVAVVCRSCNSKRGRARPRGEGAHGPEVRPLVKAEFETHMPTSVEKTVDSANDPRDVERQNIERNAKSEDRTDRGEPQNDHDARKKIRQPSNGQAPRCNRHDAKDKGQDRLGSSSAPPAFTALCPQTVASEDSRGAYKELCVCGKRYWGRSRVLKSLHNEAILP